jgi:hypothetical protein
VTPVSARALDRALGAVLVSLVRLASMEFNANPGAGVIRFDDTVVKQAVTAIVARAALIGGKGCESLVHEALKSRLDKWKAEIAQKGAHLGYQGKNDGKTVGLLAAPSVAGWEIFTCLNSLRDVEPTVNLLLDDYPMDSGQGGGWSFPAAPAAAGVTEHEGENKES